MKTLIRAAMALAIVAAMFVAPEAQAIHLYRNTGGGCSAADGELTDDPHGTHGPLVTTVELAHNAYIDQTSLTPVTRIHSGDAVKWTWNSAHCHSVTFSGWDSGFHYPTTAPDSPQAIPGLFEYPVLTDSPSLSYVHTFTSPGTFTYLCVHHSSIGMQGVVIVDP
jgi:plastocyanin